MLGRNEEGGPQCQEPIHRTHRSIGDESVREQTEAGSAINVGSGLRRYREMATIGKLEKHAFRPLQPLEKIMAKKESGKADSPIRTIKETLTKSALINLMGPAE